MDIKDTAKKLPNTFGDEVMKFAKLTTDSYHNGAIQGEIKVLEELRTEVQRKLNDAKARYEKTEIGAVMKKVRDG